MKSPLVLALFLFLVAACGKSESSDHAATESVPAVVEGILPAPIRGKDYRLVFEENFDGPAGAPASKERWSDWHPGSRKDAFNVAEACRLDGKGNLVITVKRANGRIEAGGIDTRRNFAATHGYYECRCRLLDSPGAWSAFWLQSPTIGKPLGDPANAGVEMDVIEYFPGHRKYKDQARHTAHWDGYDKRHHKKESVFKAMPGLAGDYHTFAMKWDDEGYVFYIDGVESGRLRHTPVSNRPQYLILSCEVAKWSGDISKARLPGTFLVDHVRVWQTPKQIEADRKRPDAVRPRTNPIRIPGR
jgi:beta-glucanase (GH16 family)